MKIRLTTVLSIVNKLFSQAVRLEVVPRIAKKMEDRIIYSQVFESEISYFEKNTGMKQPFFQSFRVAFSGMMNFFRSDRNGGIHLGVTVLVLIAGRAFNISATEWMVALLSVALVIVAEMLNNAIEKVCDLVNPAPDPRVKVIKDVSAAAVLVAAVISSVIGIMIFLPKIWTI